MNFPASTISLDDISALLGLTKPVSMDSLYTKGVIGVPTSGTISLNDFRGKAVPSAGFGSGTSSMPIVPDYEFDATFLTSGSTVSTWQNIGTAGGAFTVNNSPSVITYNSKTAVDFNPSLNSHFINIGAVNFNNWQGITNPGFTVIFVAKMNSTGANQRIFDSGTAYGSNNNRFSVGTFTSNVSRVAIWNGTSGALNSVGSQPFLETSKSLIYICSPNYSRKCNDGILYL